MFSRRGANTGQFQSMIVAPAASEKALYPTKQCAINGIVIAFQKKKADTNREMITVSA